MYAKKISTTIMSIFLLLLLFTGTAFAENSYNSNTVERIRNGTQSVNDVEMSYGAENYGLGSVTMEEASSWVDRKGFEIVGFLQKIVQPIAIIAFIVCGFMILFGNVSGGGIGAAISIVVYICTIYAPEIFEFVLNWVRT